jgi:hypothetical protein
MVAAWWAGMAHAAMVAAAPPPILWPTRSRASASADLRDSLRHGLGHHAVDAEHREPEREDRKKPDQTKHEAARREDLVDPLLERRDAGERLIRIDSAGNIRSRAR